MTAQQKRRIKLIRPSLQLSLIGCFLALTTMALVVQFLVPWRALESAAAEIETAGGPLTEQFLGSVARREQIEPCRLIADDELQGSCELLNAATAPERGLAAAAQAGAAENGAAEESDAGLAA